MNKLNVLNTVFFGVLSLTLSFSAVICTVKYLKTKPVGRYVIHDEQLLIDTSTGEMIHFALNSSHSDNAFKEWLIKTGQQKLDSAKDYALFLIEKKEREDRRKANIDEFVSRVHEATSWQVEVLDYSYKDEEDSKDNLFQILI